MTSKKRLNRKSSDRKHRILVPLGSLTEAEILIPLARAISKIRHSDLIVMNIIISPGKKRLSEETSSVSQARQTLNEYLIQHNYDIPEIQTIVRLSEEVWDSIWETVYVENSVLLLLGWQSLGLQQSVVGDLADSKLVDPPCDLALIRPAVDVGEHAGWSNQKRILLPVRGGPNASLALRTAQALAMLSENGEISLLHAVKQAPREAEAKLFSNFGAALRSLHQLTRAVTVVGNVAETIVREAQLHDAIVMGAPSNTPSHSWRNETVDRISSQFDGTLIIVKQRSEELGTDQQVSPRTTKIVDRPIAVVVDNWFAENTFHSREFANLDTLVNFKQNQGITISLGLPALNEEATVGNVITTLKTDLMENYPLLDEIVLIDSGSTDYTREIAEDQGIPVYLHADILPQYGSYHGKGEALWKSLYVLQGDLIVWIDTDISNIHSRFVYGVLGPLLHNLRIQYVKGFYRRPLRKDNKLVAGGGGRVTELTARPLINLFYPELSGIIQPLSGEYAGRRSLFEQLPFFTGYGVETGLLLDILDQFGLNTIAQSDLLRRIHHNQTLPSLSKMSFTIIQVFMNRLARRHDIHLLDEANLTMNFPRYSPERYFLATEELIEQERPPMITIPEYRSRFFKQVRDQNPLRDRDILLGGNST
ncbi:MAG: glucosyl-3-phosphoglycerate synthase [Anaerolineales bacterium]